MNFKLITLLISLFWGLFLFGQNTDSPKIELITFEEANCDTSACLHFKIEIHEAPKKIKIYILDRWGNVLSEYKELEGFYPLEKTKIGVYNLSVIAKYKKKETLKIQKSITLPSK